MRTFDRGTALFLSISICTAFLASTPSTATAEFRSIDGSGNNLIFNDMNATGTSLARHMGAAYDDRVSQMAGGDRPNPRVISNVVNSQRRIRHNRHRLTDYFWLWGQFLDHDLDLTESSASAGMASIPVPMGDEWFDPASTGTQTITFMRSKYDEASGTDYLNPREQINEVTGWIDASQVYGSNEQRATALRTMDGTGRLKTSSGDLLPFNTMGLPNAGGNGSELFLAGDVRANENVGLTAMHTLFVREHNRLAGMIRQQEPTRSGDEIYEMARRLVGIEMQIITYREFLPALLGRQSAASLLSLSRRYDPLVDSSISNEFSAAAYRVGHSMVSHRLRRLGHDNKPDDTGSLPLRSAFFAPQEIAAHGIESILRGAAMQRCQNVDVFVVDDIRNFLFGEPGQGGFDLAALNIQRGRDHGIPAYNAIRASMGFDKAESFADITRNRAVQRRLAEAYSTPDYVDMWVGGLAERHMDDAMVGELFHAVIFDQFLRLAIGDRFFYTRSMTLVDRMVLGPVTLADIIRRNTAIGPELANDVFHMPMRQGPKRFKR